MALWSVAFLGSTPIGGPAIGWVTAHAGARVGLGVGAASCFVAGVLGLLAIRHLHARALARQTESTGQTESMGQEGVDGDRPSGPPIPAVDRS